MTTKRPPTAPSLHLRLPPALLARLDRYCHAQGMTRSEAVRHLIRQGTKA